MDVRTLAARLGVPARCAARAEELVRLAAAKMGSAGSAALVRPAVCLDLACAECVLLLHAHACARARAHLRAARCGVRFGGRRSFQNDAHCVFRRVRQAARACGPRRAHPHVRRHLQGA
jgi:hypothetical protein